MSNKKSPFNNPILWFFLVMMLLSNPVLLILLPIVLFFALPYLMRNQNFKNFFSNFTKFKSKHMANVYDIKQKSKSFAGTFILIVLAIFLLPRMIVIIPAGHTGVYDIFGKVKPNELHSGLHIVNPFARIIEMDIRTQDYTMSVVSGEGRRSQNDSITAITKEGLSVDLDITVLFKLDESKADSVYKNIGLTYDEIVIRPAIRSVIREVVSKYDAKEIYSEKREESSLEIRDSLSKNLNEKGILIEEVLLRNVVLPEKVSSSIEEKLSAEQEAQKYDFVLEKEKKEAERKIIEATAQRDAQKIINESLNQKYLHYEYIKNLKDIKGTIYVPTSPSTGIPLFRGL